MILTGKKVLFGILFLLVSCAPSTQEDLALEGESQTRKLAKELRAIETKEDLQKAIPRLKKQFNKLADLALIAQSFVLEDSEPSAASFELFAELARLYEMPNGRELIESAQAEAVHRLR